MKLADQLAAREIVGFLGPGGVGKTTISAAAALEAARQGRRTLVLTIDPARRLADAMGMKLGSDAVEVRPNLHALMLDTKSALDELIEKYAPNPETMRRIFRSRFYENLSDAFAGSEEFVAMGELYELVHSGRWDTIVVDTPPSRHAIDFLETNRKLIRVFESGVVRYLFKPTRVLRLGGGYVAGVLAKWTSQQYLEEMSEFIVTFDQMFLDMEARVRTMQRILADRTRTTLNLVTAADRDAVANTLALAADVRRLDHSLETCIVNRAYPLLRGMEHWAALERDGPYRDGAVRIVQETLGAGPAAARGFVDQSAAAAGFYDALAREQAAEMDRLRAGLDVPLVLVPALAGSIHDLDGLERVRGRLVGE